MDLQRKWIVALLAIAATVVLIIVAVQLRTDGDSFGKPYRKAAVTDGKEAGEEKPRNPASPAIFDFVDPRATAHTRSLYAYLSELRGQRILFGHQHATTESIASSSAPIVSDVQIAVGDYPAIFGWDTLSIEGKERPGIWGNAELSRERLIAAMKEAHGLGGIVALSTHPTNFVTGGSFNDTTGGVVAEILPGGSKHAELNRYLDNIAYVASNLKDDNGEPIPLLFRPFHEQNGSWFWWGARTTRTAEYIALYRYTVEYLRDAKDVHNLLYVFSPNGPFGGDESEYLKTYPGDAYVDILGMDQYDNLDRPGTPAFLDGLTQDLAMINRLADDKSKVAALSEFGYSPQGMKTTGNGDLEWFSKMLGAIKSDPDARRTAYMQTWANFALDGNLFVPYRGAPDDHELLPDFVAFYEDDYTAFAKEAGPIYGREAEAAAEAPLLHIAIPTADAIVVGAPVQVSARLLHAEAEDVTLTARGAGKGSIAMALDASGYYTADWVPKTAADGDSVALTVAATLKDGTVLEDRVQIRYKARSEEPTSETLYGYEEGLDGWAINDDNDGTWNTAQATGAGRTDAEAAEGKHALQADFALGGGSFELARVGSLDLSDAAAITAQVKLALHEGADAGSGVRVKLFVKTGDSWSWTDSGETILTSGEFEIVVFELRNAAGKDAVQAIGLQVMSPDDSSGGATIFLDHVAAIRE